MVNNNFLNDQMASLREAKPSTLSINRTTSAPFSNTTTPPKASISNQILIESPRATFDQNDTSRNQNSILTRAVKNTTVIGDYVLYNPQSENDVFGNALNTKLNQLFYWKVSDK